MTYPPYNGGVTPEYVYDKTYVSPSPTPSPRHGSTYYYAATPTPQRPATRAHFRHSSTSTPQTFSPRYTSDGHYATVNVSSSRKHFGSSTRTKRERRNSYSYSRTPLSHGDYSDEDEVYEVDGVTYVMLGRSNSRKFREYFYAARGYHGTNHSYYVQDYSRDSRESTPLRDDTATPKPRVHTRRASTSVPQRPQTARPSSSQQKAAAAAAAAAAAQQHRYHHQQPHAAHHQAHQQQRKPPVARQATEEDAKRHKIPPGYSLKNWDPSEEPIMLLGSVFDSNSLGRWIYDWTVYHHGAAQPLSDMAGELWLLLIQLAGKIKKAEEAVPKIRSQENKDMVEDFIESGERLTDKLRKLIKTCEAPMLKASSRKDGAQLGMNSGIEFVKTLFGRDRELEKTEKFMQSVRLWNLRFNANCEEILKNPTM